MESAFGADLTAARARGSERNPGAETGDALRDGVTFAPGVTNLSMGAVDRGAAMPTHALSAVSASSAAGPMQAKKNDKAQQAPPEAVRPANAATPEKPKSNDAFESAFKGITNLSEKTASVAESLSDSDAMRKHIRDALLSAQDVAGNVGSRLKIKPLEDGSALNTVRQAGISAVNQLDQWGIPDAAAQVSKYAPLVGASASLPTAVMNFGGSIDKVDKARESGSSSAVTNAQLDAASSLNSAVKTGAGFTSTLSGHFGSDAAKATAAGAKQVSKYSGYVGQGLGLVKDLYNLGESTQRKNSMRESAEAMERRLPAPEERSAAEQEHLAIFRQGTDSAGQDQKQAGVNTFSHSLGLASAITKAAGAEPVGTGLDVAKKVFDFAAGEVMSCEKDKFHTDTVEDKLHTKEAFEGFQNEDRLRAFHVSPEAYRKAQLRLQGYKSGTTDEAFEGISKKRAEMLASSAAKDEAWAQEYASNAGIDTEGIDRSDTHREAVTGAFLKSLGGNKDAEFHSSNVLEYNAFRKAADENAAAKKRGFWGDLKYKAKNFGAATWESVKTGGKKIVSAGKGIGRGVKKLFQADTWKKGWDTVSTGAKKAAGAIGRGAVKAGKGLWGLMTSADARKQAWEATKTGAVNAVKGIGRGAKYAWNVAKHSATSRYEKIRDWYQEGVDQMNVHGDTYKEMGALDKLVWSAKNLPARLFHGTAKNKQATAIRFNRALTADEAAQHMADFAQERTAQPAQAGEPAPSDIIHSQYEQAVADAQPSQGPERPSAADVIHSQYEQAVADAQPAERPARPSALDTIHAQYEDALAQGSSPAPETEEAPGSLLAQLQEQLRMLQESPL